ncbi:hypothetical protein [Kitasatospora xanthocidica]|uniref:hypothetical protein n=1 Tax=Kitasatospora xanthocidica TaxID=83382 RepID=UPI0016798FEF|nr:hypothetical protein [Kitasatospora xanthocidica]
MTTELIVFGSAFALHGIATAFDIRNAAKWWQLLNYQYRQSDLALRTVKIIGAIHAALGTAAVVVGLAT